MGTASRNPFLQWYAKVRRTVWADVKGRGNGLEGQEKSHYQVINSQIKEAWVYGRNVTWENVSNKTFPGSWENKDRKDIQLLYIYHKSDICFYSFLVGSTQKGWQQLCVKHREKKKRKHTMIFWGSCLQWALMRGTSLFLFSLRASTQQRMLPYGLVTIC